MSSTSRRSPGCSNKPSNASRSSRRKWWAARPASPAPAPGVDAELKALLRKVKLGRCLDTLAERLALARTESLPHADFLTLLLSDEVERRDRSSAQLRARAAKLDPAMRIDTFATDTGVSFDRELWNELC